MKKLIFIFAFAFILFPIKSFALSDTVLYSIDGATSYYNVNDKVPPFGANDRFISLNESVYGQSLMTRVTIPTFSSDGYDISFTDLTSQDSYDLSECGDNGCNASYSIRLGLMFGCSSNFCGYQSTDIPINDNTLAGTIDNLDFANYVINHIELVYRDLNGRVWSSPLVLDSSKEYFWSITQYGFALWFNESPYTEAIFQGSITNRNFAEFIGIRFTYDMSINDFVSSSPAVNTLQITFYNNLSLTYTDQEIGSLVPIPDVDESPDIGNLINDSSVDNSKANSTLNGIGSSIATNTVISDLLLLPINMYQRIINVANSNTCQRYYLGSLYDYDLYLPCFSFSDYLGSSIWTTIDIFISGYFVLAIRKKFVDIFNNLTSLKDRGNEIE